MTAPPHVPFSLSPSAPRPAPWAPAPEVARAVVMDRKSHSNRQTGRSGPNILEPRLGGRGGGGGGGWGRSVGGAIGIGQHGFGLPAAPTAGYRHATAGQAAASEITFRIHSEIGIVISAARKLETLAPYGRRQRRRGHTATPRRESEGQALLSCRRVSALFVAFSRPTRPSWRPPGWCQPPTRVPRGARTRNLD